jgi:hypothetical protein
MEPLPAVILKGSRSLVDVPLTTGYVCRDKMPSVQLRSAGNANPVLVVTHQMHRCGPVGLLNASSVIAEAAVCPAVDSESAAHNLGTHAQLPAAYLLGNSALHRRIPADAYLIADLF